ncbi:MAG: hypothetical protein SF053_01290 [Bacteroidia bacterium]|nr:hypothetical protein [Bacteroidia bacterium]
MNTATLTRALMAVFAGLMPLLGVVAQADTTQMHRYRRELGIDIRYILPVTIIVAQPNSNANIGVSGGSGTTLIYRWRASGSRKAFRPGSPVYWRLQANISADLYARRADSLQVNGTGLTPYLYAPPFDVYAAVSLGKEFRHYRGRMAGYWGVDVGPAYNGYRTNTPSQIYVFDNLGGVWGYLMMQPGFRRTWVSLSAVPFIGFRYGITPRMSVVAEAAAFGTVYYSLTQGSYVDGAVTRQWQQRDVGFSSGVNYLRTITLNVHF